MKSTLAKYVNLLMTCLVLLSSTGFGLVEHSCQIRGKRLFLVQSKQEGCNMCSASKHVTASQEPVVKKTDCCKEEQRHAKLDFTSSFSNLLAKMIKAAADVAVISLAAVFHWLVDWLVTTETSVADSIHAPPSFYGRSLLALVQNFRL